MVEGNEGNGEKEGRNLEYHWQLEYRLARKEMEKTLGWKVLTDKVNTVYKSRTVDGKQLTMRQITDCYPALQPHGAS
jgi:hypothetical protein